MTKTNSKECKKFNSYWVVYFKVLFCLGLIKFNTCFLKDSGIAESRIFGLSFFSSPITDGNKELLKKLYLSVTPFTV